jgi:succinate dehydrogenase flavin-adding protein (antitoxin of CptAB toxin-antitoxin module)
MELLLNSFVKKHINDFSITELKQLDKLLNFDDGSLFKWYLNKKIEIKIPNNKVSKLLKNFKI